MAKRVFSSPWTGDAWIDARTAVGTLAGFATFFNEKRPRRRPPEGHDTAIALATDAAGSYAGIPKLTRTGEVEGRVISDAYWQAKDARQRLTSRVGERFLRDQEWRGEMRLRDLENGRYEPEPDVTYSTRAARIAWYAAALTEKACADSQTSELHPGTYGQYAVLGAFGEVEDSGVDRETSMDVERVWRFVVAAGRMPRHPEDDDLLAAFEAALMAGENEFATNLVKHGFGFRV